MRILLLVAALVALAGSARGQAPADIAGRAADLNHRALDFGGHVVDLAFRVRDLRLAVIDMAGKPVETAGKVQALNVKETATEIRIELAADVLFDVDKADIRRDAASALHQVADIIRDKGQGRAVRVEGHTDGKGSDAYNQKLSERRALSVKQWLAQKEGLDGSHMATQGFGARKPVAPNMKPDGSDDPDGRQKNRRVEIVLAK
jgi:outer membrane protein OmpA-like peptidoglycan-associated protein